MSTTQRMYPHLPYWAAVVYRVLAITLIPWITYLALTLPTRHLSHHWDISWVGIDVAIAALLLLNAVLSLLASGWLVMSATATATLLCTDAWFDVMSAHAGAPLFQAVASAAGIELPLAALTFVVAVRALQRRG